MNCRNCVFYASGMASNYCRLFEAENFRPFTKENQCKIVSDDFIATENFEPFRIAKGENLLLR